MRKLISIGMMFFALTLCCQPASYVPKHNGNNTPGGGGNEGGTGDGSLHRVYDIEAWTTVNSHAGEEKWSVLQPMYNDFSVQSHNYLVPGTDLSDEQKTVYYTRIKKMADGRYLLLYMGGQTGSRCYCTTSDDLKTWAAPTMLLEPVQETVDGAKDWIRYSGPDAVVLSNGDVLAVFSYRATNHYKYGTGCGLVTMRSKNNGLTWSQPQIIYDAGATWEPYMLELPDGRIQCYFTDPIPACRNSGTSVLTSTDGGYTWSSKIRCSRYYKYDYDGSSTAYRGKKIFTDQMPSFRVLNDGKTLIGFLEARLESPASDSGNSYYKCSVVYNDGFDWKNLGEDTAGPARRHDLVVNGAAGYVSTFPSGEVVLSCNISSIFSLKILDHNGENFNAWDSGWLKAFTDAGSWGNTESEDGNKLLASFRSASRGAQIGRFWLNHTLFATDSKVTVDGKADEWPLKQALFVSGKNGSELMIRASRDASNLYLLADQYDVSSVKIYVSNTAPKLTVKAEISSKGSMTLSGDGVTGKCVSAETVKGGKGHVAEIKIPLSTLGASTGDAVYVYASVADSAGEVPFTNAVVSSPSTWQRIVLK
ncbi:MAG: exo-alpha-sialidase [Bacteroidales bacterium]|nr:exo-alpha-sialidase [Bacteroidales bacterium]